MDYSEVFAGTIDTFWLTNYTPPQMTIESGESPHLLSSRESFNYPFDDENFSVGFVDVILLNDENLFSRYTNKLLRESGRPERFRAIIMGDGILAEGIWTTKEAGNLAAGLNYEEDGPLRVSPEKYKEQHSEDGGVISFQVDPVVVDILKEGKLLQRKKGEDNRYIMRHPGNIRWVERVYYLTDFEVSIDEEGTDYGKVWFNLEMTALRGGVWDLLQKRLYPKLEVKKQT